MKRFDKHGVIIIGSVLLVVGILTYFNLKVSLRRARDFQRKEDIKNIANALISYNEDFGYFPTNDNNGKIIACGSPLQACNWGWDSLKPYLPSIPTDPINQSGYSYAYFSNGNHFQIFASLEGTDEDEYSISVAKRGLICGVAECNFGRSDGRTPLDKSLEEYENEVRSKK